MNEKEIERIYENFHDMCVTIKCDNCGKKEEVHGADDGVEAADYFYEKGWRVTIHRNCYCPECVKKKLKRRKSK